jgi:hypothetical protein
MRYWFVLLLAGCTASNWTKEGATVAELDRDYDECRDIAKLDLATGAVAGAFGAVGVFVGNTYKDSKIRTCLQARGWNIGPINDKLAATAAAGSTEPVSSAAMPVRTVDTEAPAARRLRELKSLRDQGYITKEEYEQRRQAVLGAL